MKYFDIHRVPKQRPHQLHQGNSYSEQHFRAETPQELKLQIDPVIQLAAERLKQQYTKQSFNPAKIIRLKSIRFQKAYALFAFTFFLLGFGIFLGARFVSFANSVSTSTNSFYKSVTNDIGAVFGPYIPSLKQLNDTKVSAAINNKEKINLLLLGYGGEGHSGGLLTDTMMLLNIDFATNKVTYIPVPRDTWLKIPTRGYDGNYAKINAAYAFGADQTRYPNKLPQFTGINGGGNLAKYAIEQVTGIKVDYYMSMDFSGFKKVVDALGGVSVDVENAFTDYTYPSGSANVNAPSCTAEDIPDSLITNCRYKQVHFEKGEQFFDGARALEYVRSRHAAGAEGSDFARSRRQQKLIAAIEQKAINFGSLPKIFSIMDSIQGHFKTDLSFAEIKDLSKYINQSNDQNIQTVTISESKLLVASKSGDGQWILIPTPKINAEDQTYTNFDDFSAIHQFISSEISSFANKELPQ